MSKEVIQLVNMFECQNVSLRAASDANLKMVEWHESEETDLNHATIAI